MCRTTDDAVSAIRHVVQEHGDEHTVLGAAADAAPIQWFGELLGWQWPHSYLVVLAKHDGVMVQDAIVHSFLKSFECFLVHHDRWYKPRHFWPVAEDGCGNYWVLCLRQSKANNECPVAFLDHESDGGYLHPEHIAAETYADFVIMQMAEQCDRCGCADLQSQEGEK
jgi:hypothetical protein